MNTLFRAISWLFFATIVLCLLAALGLGGLYLYFNHDLPQITSLQDYRPLTISEVFDRNGEKIGEFWQERRRIVRFDDIPKSMVQAIVSSEDQRFFEHSGIDYLGILRAAVRNLKAGRVVEGGSSITQQITKSLILSKERTYTRKIKEALLAKQIEEHLSKSEILYLYMTQTYFGNRAFGIGAAAENYFHKPLKELALPEMALLAGLPKAPSAFSPFKNPVRTIARQHYVLDRMAEDSYITREEAEAAKKSPLTIYRAETDKEWNSRYAPWFTEHIRRTATETYGADLLYRGGLKIETTVDLPKQKIAQTAVQRGLRALDKRQGYKGPIGHVPSDKALATCQNFAEELAESEKNRVIYLNATTESTPRPLLESETLYRAVVTALNSDTQELEVCAAGQIGLIRHFDFQWARERNLKIAGWEGVDYLSDPAKRFAVGDLIEVALKTPTPEEIEKGIYRSGQTYFSLEQTPEIEGALFSYDPTSGEVLAMVGGYDFKRSEFNRAIQALRQPGSAFKPFIYTSAVTKGYRPDTVISDSPIAYEWLPGQVWRPRNYGNKFYGPTPLRTALARSQNIVAVRILIDVGTDFVTAVARLMGITTPITRYYAMALGANDMQLHEITRAYGAIATGGILPDTHYVRRIADQSGKIVAAYTDKTPLLFTSYFVQSDDGTPSLDPTYLSPDSPAEDYNPDLYERGMKTLEAEKLNLTGYEQKLLYGRHIPPGYTLNPKVAHEMRDLLTGVVERGTATKAKVLNRPAAGKTGTTNNESDAWFIGFVPQLVTGVWTGFDSRQTIGARETGGKAALPIWIEYMQAALDGQPVLAFETPPQALSPAFDVAHEAIGIGTFDPGKIPQQEEGALEGENTAEPSEPSGVEETGEEVDAEAPGDEEAGNEEGAIPLPSETPPQETPPPANHQGSEGFFSTEF